MTSIGLSALVAGLLAAPLAEPARLRVDPLLLAQAESVWRVIARDDNPIWPGWNASSTPILVYLPGVQDVLVNHPNPPDDFVPCSGPHTFLGSRSAIRVKDGDTLIEWDGQNTSREIFGVETLVLADTLSNRKMTFRGILEDPRSAETKLGEIEYETRLLTDPYAQMSTIAHEAFHVFQARSAPGKAPNERDVRLYPCLSVENNVGFALEGRALAEILRAADASAAREAAVRFLAVRLDRRASLPEKAVAYEDGNEFSEGLAMYVEFALPAALERTQPARELYWAQGFDGFSDLSRLRERKIEALVRNMRGEVNVNNDPFGTSPLRGRLYFSGMAIGAALDRFAPEWKSRVFADGVTLTGLLREALNPSPSELEAALAAARRDPEYASLLAAKTRLAEEGRADIAAQLAAIEGGDGATIVVDYSALGSPPIGLSFTAFGVRMVDADRTIYTLVPIEAQIGSAADGFRQSIPLPTLEDRRGKTYRFALPEPVGADRLAEILGDAPRGGEPVRDLDLAFPGVRVTARRATVELKGHSVLVRCLPVE